VSIFDDTDTDTDKAIVYQALVGYANWIETGNFLLSARDASERKEPFNALEPSQMRRVLRLRELADQCLSDRLRATRSAANPPSAAAPRVAEIVDDDANPMHSFGHGRGDR
jgi:hypothetical protein